MKVKATYRDLKDVGKDDFKAKVVELEWPDQGKDVKELNKRIKENAPPGYVFESLELL